MSGTARLKRLSKKRPVKKTILRPQQAVTWSKMRRKKVQQKATEKARRKERLVAAETARAKGKLKLKVKGKGKKRMMVLTTRRIVAWNCISNLNGRQLTGRSTSGASSSSCRPSLTTKCSSNCALSSS